MENIKEVGQALTTGDAKGKMIPWVVGPFTELGVERRKRRFVGQKGSSGHLKFKVFCEHPRVEDQEGSS